MQGCNAAWQEDGLCFTSKFMLDTVVLTFQCRAEKIYKWASSQIYIYYALYFKQQKCRYCFYAPTHPTAPLTLSVSTDQNTGLYSCGILIWDLWSLIAYEQWVNLGGKMSRCAVWPEALWVCIAEGGEGVWLGHWQLIQAHTLQVVQVVGVQRSLFFCLCVYACVWERKRQVRNCQ